MIVHLVLFQKNTQCDLKVKLDHSIQIEKDNWEVGLVENITNIEVNNITKENKYVILRFSDRKMCEEIDNCSNYGFYVDQKIYIQNGYYAFPRHLVGGIQKSINFQYGQTLKNSNATITISYDQNSARSKLDVQDPMKVKIIAEIVGVDRNYFDKPGESCVTRALKCSAMQRFPNSMQRLCLKKALFVTVRCATITFLFKICIHINRFVVLCLYNSSFYISLSPRLLKNSFVAAGSATL